MTILSALLVASYAFWDLGADRLSVCFGRLIIRVLSFGRIRVTSEIDEGTAIGVSTCIMLTLFFASFAWRRECSNRALSLVSPFEACFHRLFGDPGPRAMRWAPNERRLWP